MMRITAFAAVLSTVSIAKTPFPIGAYYSLLEILDGVDTTCRAKTTCDACLEAGCNNCNLRDTSSIYFRAETPVEVQMAFNEWEHQSVCGVRPAKCQTIVDFWTNSKNPAITEIVVPGFNLPGINSCDQDADPATTEAEGKEDSSTTKAVSKPSTTQDKKESSTTEDETKFPTGAYYSLLEILEGVNTTCRAKTTCDSCLADGCNNCNLRDTGAIYFRAETPEEVRRAFNEWEHESVCGVRPAKCQTIVDFWTNSKNPAITEIVVPGFNLPGINSCDQDADPATTEAEGKEDSSTTKAVSRTSTTQDKKESSTTEAKKESSSTEEEVTTEGDSARSMLALAGFVLASFGTNHLLD